jgi:ABC-type uncharacterized transport system permease subunit
MDRQFLVISTLCYFAAVVRFLIAVRNREGLHGHFSFFAIAIGFVFQTAFLSWRGHSLGRCPLTNLFEVFIFLAWSVALIYLVVGPTYRLSLMGAFTAPLVFTLQTFALIAPIDRPQQARFPVNSWLEFHASISMVAYGAFALACVAGVMYMIQERQLKTHHLHSYFYHLPPLTNLFAALTRLLWFGFGLYSAGLVSGFFTGGPLPRVKTICAIGVWALYAIILQGRHWRWFAPKRVAALCVVAFSAAISVLWAIEFVSQNRSM